MYNIIIQYIGYYTVELEFQLIYMNHHMYIMIVYLMEVRDHILLHNFLVIVHLNTTAAQNYMLLLLLFRKSWIFYHLN